MSRRLPRDGRQADKSLVASSIDEVRSTYGLDAKHLPDPTLNVMFGEAATKANAYGATSNHVLVKMTLGDLRRAGGGQVFYDTSAKGGGSTAQPLIVTLPKGALVPVDLIRKP